MIKVSFRIKSLTYICALALFSLLFSACGGSEPAAAATATPSISGVTAAPGVAVLKVYNDPKLGPILVNQNGLTLYQFQLDSKDTSECLSTCAATWPPLISKATPVNGDPSQITGKIGVITRPDGSPQVTYNGMPLYNFTLDNRIGDTSGNGYSGLWSVVKP